MAVTISNTRYNTAGRYREDTFEVAAGWADADVIQTRFKKIVDVGWTTNDASHVPGTDDVNVEVLQADPDVPRDWATVTLQLTGTARAGYLTVKGY